MSEMDHRQIGKDMNLFSFHDEAPGFPFYKENFLIIRDLLLEYLKEEQRKQDYKLIHTPAIIRNDLWVQSGHWNHYRENMYWMKQEDGIINVVKPMNCPGGVLVYKEQIHSYRELPIKLAEIGRVYRKEQSGSIQGLFRTREYLMDDAHIYMKEDQIESVVNEVIDLVELLYSSLGFEYEIALSTRPEKSIGSDANWNNAIEALKQVLDNRKASYQIKEGNGAFYGPKIDFDIKDSLGRKWQCGTIQLDFNLPERFNLYYVDSNLKQKRIVMLHRAILGGVERLLAILLEHYQGKLPLWLAPVQIMLLNINDKVLPYLEVIQRRLEKQGFRVIKDDREESLERRIREGTIQKINYFIIIGSKEEQAKSISVRRRDNKRYNNIQLADFIKQLKRESKRKELVDY